MIKKRVMSFLMVFVFVLGMFPSIANATLDNFKRPLFYNYQCETAFFNQS